MRYGEVGHGMVLQVRQGSDWKVGYGKVLQDRHVQAKCGRRGLVGRSRKGETRSEVARTDRARSGRN